MDIRIGHGYDVHALAEGLRLVLCGVEIEHTKGCVAHSDGDVAIHAICDALLGAANLRDIGYHFPDNASEYKNIDSKILLEKTVALLEEKGYGIGNIDAVVSAQAPKLKPYIEEMKLVLAKIMKIDVDCVSIKATTTEKLGFVGREEGMAAQVAVLIAKL